MLPPRERRKRQRRSPIDGMPLIDNRCKVDNDGKPLNSNLKRPPPPAKPPPKPPCDFVPAEKLFAADEPSEFGTKLGIVLLFAYGMMMLGIGFVGGYFSAVWTT